MDLSRLLPKFFSLLLVHRCRALALQFWNAYRSGEFPLEPRGGERPLVIAFQESPVRFLLLQGLMVFLFGVFLAFAFMLWTGWHAFPIPGRL